MLTIIYCLKCYANIHKDKWVHECYIPESKRTLDFVWERNCFPGHLQSEVCVITIILLCLKSYGICTLLNFMLMSLISCTSLGFHRVPLSSPQKVIRNREVYFWRNSWVEAPAEEILVWVSLSSISWQTSRNVCQSLSSYYCMV